ncbi:protein EARLY RESPONSIVE TO DEHYDRATION 15-like [Cucumis sativus]|uniref:Poly(A)-binding protein C-terminal interacting protein 6 n=1 Tax=Cucumis sativus TaxID=3659 RepID=Q6ELF9_CUCSA|nr:protein EARLY RESPONSIVE TO DEHYDRATION 15-like [Cucumis sativus]AAQ18141.1 poly(A)-binding protein C-terminal interacting protein 6 [Cucumis sativus]
MDVVTQRNSSSSVSMLNPNAPLFVPMAYRTVEDFSDQWWELIQSSPWFREYWLQERFQDPQNELSFGENEEFILPDLESFFDDFTRQQEEEELEFSKDLVPMGAFKWQKARSGAEVPKYAQKAPKIVNVKVSESENDSPPR